MTVRSRKRRAKRSAPLTRRARRGDRVGKAAVDPILTEIVRNGVIAVAGAK